MAGLLAIFAEFEREILRERVNAAPGMGDHRRSPTGEMRCAISMRQVRARRRLPGGWGSAEPRYDGFSAKRRGPILCKIGTVTSQWRLMCGYGMLREILTIH